MNLISANVAALRNMMTLNARATRSEYWWVFATYLAVIFLGVIIKASLFPYGDAGGPLYNWAKFIYVGFILLWGLALCSLSVRRLHDSDMSGLWVWLYLFAFPLGVFLIPILCLKSGTKGENRFGPDPKSGA